MKNALILIGLFLASMADSLIDSLLRITAPQASAIGITAFSVLLIYTVRKANRG